MKNNLFCFLTCLLTFLLPALATAQDAADTTLVINEVMAANLDQYLDNANCYGSWIELYNPTQEDIPLSGKRLTDGENEVKLSSVHGSVPAGGFKTLWFDHYYTEGAYGSNARRQIPYKLEYEGGTISLLDADLSVISSVTYPPATPRCSWARTVDGGSQWGTTAQPTPDATNATSLFATRRLRAPAVDKDSQTFRENFTVKVIIPKGTTLRYTTDGSAPTPTNGETSTNGRFDITATTVLRLCLFSDGYLPSPVVTRSYIYCNHDYYLPILSICSDPKNFYDDMIGVFVRGTNGIAGNGQNTPCNWNMDWERPINMEYLVPSTMVNGQSSMVNDQWSMFNVQYSTVLSQEADLEICGGYTRAYGGATVDDRYWPARSSFRIKADKRYEGANVISCPVFPLKKHNKYRCWQVRNGGNDTYARIKDPAIQQIVLRSGFYVDCQDYQPAHVFLNGEYYGMLNIRESNNKHFAYSNYGISFDDMDQFDLSNGQYNQKVGDNKAWTQLQNMAKHLGQTRSEATYREICKLLDIDEFINYMALECYIGPTDWITNNNNVKGFRSRTDGKFHFVLFDTDSGFGNSDMLSAVLNSSVTTNVDDLFRNLMKYNPIRRQFVDAFCIVDGSVFEPSRCERIIREISTNTNPALAFEGSSSSLKLASNIRSAYNGSRISNMRSTLGLTYNLYACLSSNIAEARLAVNGQEIPTGKFAGYLFSYRNLPVQLTAKAPAGYVFSGWMTEEGNTLSTSESIDLHEMFESNSEFELQAVYTPIADQQQRLAAGATPLRINEVSAGNDIYINDYGKKTDWIELYNTTAEDISLKGLYLSDKRGEPRKYQIQDDGFIVPAYGTCIIWCDGKEAVSQPHAAFKLENADGAFVSIQAADSSWADSLEYVKQGKWQTFGRYPDGGRMTALLNQPTIDKANKIGMLDHYDITDDWFNPVGIEPALASSAEIRSIQYFNLAGQLLATDHAPSIHPSTFNSQLSTFNFQLSTFNSQLSTFNSQLSTFNSSTPSGIFIRKVTYEDGRTEVTKHRLLK